jgi:hypothetical protein
MSARYQLHWSAYVETVHWALDYTICRGLCSAWLELALSMRSMV